MTNEFVMTVPTWHATPSAWKRAEQSSLHVTCESTWLNLDLIVKQRSQEPEEEAE